MGLRDGMLIYAGRAIGHAENGAVAEARESARYAARAYFQMREAETAALHAATMGCEPACSRCREMARREVRS